MAFNAFALFYFFFFVFAKQNNYFVFLQKKYNQKVYKPITINSHPYIFLILFNWKNLYLLVDKKTLISK